MNKSYLKYFPTSKREEEKKEKQDSSPANPIYVFFPLLSSAVHQSGFFRCESTVVNSAL